MVNALAAAGSAAGLASAEARASVSREQFLQLLVSELSNQNPLDPMDNSQFLQQLVGLQSLEQTASLTDTLRTFERFMQMSSASGLIGRSIVGFTTSGKSIEGVVSSVRMEEGKILLQVGGDQVPFHGVEEIL